MTDEPKQAQQPSEEELRAALEEQMKRVTVKDVLLQTAITLINLSARKLGLTGDAGEKDLDQARLGIEGVRALVPLLGAEEQAAVREPLSQLQMRYAQEARGAAAHEGGSEARGAGEGKETGDESSRQSPVAGGQSAAGDEEARAKARAKIWTPPGT